MDGRTLGTSCIISVAFSPQESPARFGKAPPGLIPELVFSHFVIVHTSGSPRAHKSGYLALPSLALSA